MQERSSYCRGACVPSLAEDELDHLLALPSVRKVPVVNAGDFAYACTWEPSTCESQVREGDASDACARACLEQR